jgi:ABC-2 type transport system permease protein
MNSTNVRLIAKREIRERARARSFRVTAAIGILAVVLVIALPKVLSSSTKPAQVGVVGSLSSTARAGVGLLRGVVGRPVVLIAEPDTATATAEVRASHLTATIVDSTQIIVRRSPSRQDTSTTARLAAGIAEVLREDNGLRAVGLNDSQIVSVASAPAPTITGLLPNTSGRDRQKTATLVGILMIFIFVSTYAAWILFGVLEEKSSRVVEVLMAAVRPTELLAGKIAGIGVMAVGQGVAVVVAAFITAAATGSNVLHGAVGLETIWLLGWFLLGFAFACSLYGAAGSLVSRQEEVQNVIFPIQLPMIIAYVVSEAGLVSGSASPLLKVLSFVPPTSSLAMPTRLALGPVAWWQVVIAVALLILGAFATLRLAVAVYVRAILRTGGRLRWRAVLRAPAT